MNQVKQKNTLTSLFKLDFLTVDDSIRLVINILNIFGILLALYGLYWGLSSQVLTSEVALKNFLDSFGVAAPLIFVLIQIMQTIIPIIPGAITVPMGQIVFGVMNGLFLNFTGILIGSIFNYWFARRYGQIWVIRIVGQKNYQRSICWLHDSDRFDRLFTFAMFFPFSPDDILCYIAGLSKISFRKYVTILFFAKPISIFLYSYGIVAGFEWILRLIS